MASRLKTVEMTNKSLREELKVHLAVIIGKKWGNRKDQS